MYFKPYIHNTFITSNTCLLIGEETKMENNFVPYLCGGILFSFLIELQKDTAENFHNTWGGKNALNQSEIMKKLLCVIKPDYKYNANSLKKSTSNYHMCKTRGNKVIPFETDSTRNDFDKSVRQNYDKVLERMTEFTSECFPTCSDTAMRILVERTLILIRDDNTIENATSFFINEDGSSISKEELFKKKDFNFQSFLVGVWHYIITKPTKNKDGRQTFERLFPKKEDKKRELDTQCLKPYAHEINVTYNKISKETIPEKISESKDTAEPSRTDKNENLSVKIFYRGSLLNDADETAILSDSPAIIDLNKNPDTAINNNPNSVIYKFRSEFRFKTCFISPNEEIVRLYCNNDSLNISGTTSIERWISKSKLNEMRFRKKYLCTAWFRLSPCDKEYSAEFLIIGTIE